MLSAEIADLLESGCSSIVGSVDANGVPEADRSWGQWTLRQPERIRLLVPATSSRTLANVAVGRLVALTVTEVHTLRSVQVKGRSLVVEPATPDDLALSARYVDAFFAAVHDADGTDVALLRRMAPSGVVAVECTVESVFDQTPGPTAGRCLA